MSDWVVIFEQRALPEGIALIGGPLPSHMRVDAQNASDAVGKALETRSDWEDGQLWAVLFNELTKVTVTKRYEFAERAPGWPQPKEDT